MAGGVHSTLLLRARPGDGAEIVRRYRELGVFDRVALEPGFRSATLQASADDPDELLVIAHWDSLEAYDGWLASPIRAELSQQLEPLLAGEPGVSRWRIELAFPAIG